MLNPRPCTEPSFWKKDPNISEITNKNIKYFVGPRLNRIIFDKFGSNLVRLSFVKPASNLSYKVFSECNLGQNSVIRIKTQRKVVPSRAVLMNNMSIVCKFRKIEIITVFTK